jgi:GntR family transcriptional regulator
MNNGRSSTALYQQVEIVLREKIQSGQYPIGTTIPTEQQLMASFNVSRSTIRSALKALSDDGLIKPRAGVGSLVIRAQKEARGTRLRGLTEELRMQGVATSARTLSATFQVPSPAIRAKLKLYSDERVLHLRRLRDIAGSPFALLNSYVPESLGLTPDEDFSGPLYEVIERSQRLHIIYGEDAIGARLPTAQEIDLLQITASAPVLTIRRTAFVEFDRPIEYVESAIRSDLYEYNVTLNR